MTVDVRFTTLPNSSSTFCDCIANSRVGANTSIRGDRPCLFVSDLFLDIIVNAGMEKANVLPEVGLPFGLLVCYSIK